MSACWQVGQYLAYGVEDNAFAPRGNVWHPPKAIIARDTIPDSFRCSYAPRLACSLLLLKVVAEIIDPVMGSFQSGCIQHQIRTVEATNIRVVNLLLVIYPSDG